MIQRTSSSIIVPRTGSKQAKLVFKLCKRKGVTVNKVCEAMGLRAHTVRASLSELRMRGYQRERSESNSALYSIERNRG